MKVVLYARVSTDEQTLEPQWLELDAWVARTGATVVARHWDVLSGAKGDRPGIAQVEVLAEAGGVDCVVVVKLDRLGRSVVNVLSLVNRLADRGVAIVCTSQGIDTRADSPCGKMMMAVMAAFAAFERDVIRERTVDGLKAARARGVVLGKVSEKAPRSASERQAVIAQWRADGEPGGYRGLAVRLGGCSASSAWRMARSV